MRCRRTKICILLLLGLLLVGAIVIYLRAHMASQCVAVAVSDQGLSTDKRFVYRPLPVDSLLIGKWQHHVDTTWFRVYTAEPAGDGYCWGKEWDTSEDIYEEDLQPYGNGWFKWKNDAESVLEIQMTDINGAAIPYGYRVLQIDSERMQFIEDRSAEHHHFRRI